MSRTHVSWKCYGGVDTDRPEDVEAWTRLQTALCEVVRQHAKPQWAEGGTGTLEVMHDGVSEP